MRQRSLEISVIKALYSFGAIKSIFTIREKTEVISKITEKS